MKFVAGIALGVVLGVGGHSVWSRGAAGNPLSGGCERLRDRCDRAMVDPESVERWMCMALRQPGNEPFGDCECEQQMAMWDEMKTRPRHAQ